MKVATGHYFNLFSEAGYDNYGLKVSFDIMIIFPEWMELDSDIVDTLELMLEGRLRGLALEAPFAQKEAVKETIQQVLKALDYEYERIIVDQAIDRRYLKEEK